MGLKITIELDGQTEQQLAPVLGQTLARQAHLLEGNSAPPAAQQEIHHENPATLQQTIQRLIARNQQLQSAYEQKLIADVPAQRALPTAVTTGRMSGGQQQQSYQRYQATQPRSAPAVRTEVVPPSLPAKYRPNHAQIALHQLKQVASTGGQRLWRALVWLSFGKEWLTLLILLGGITYGLVMVAPKLWTPPEFVEKTDALPGEAEKADSQPQQGIQFDTPTDEPTESSPAATTPASKAGSNPPPPPAFQK